MSNNYRNTFTQNLLIVLFAILALSACGQKGPLKVEPTNPAQSEAVLDTVEERKVTDVETNEVEEVSN